MLKTIRDIAILLHFKRVHDASTNLCTVLRYSQEKECKHILAVVTDLVVVMELGCLFACEQMSSSENISTLSPVVEDLSSEDEEDKENEDETFTPDGTLISLLNFLSAAKKIPKFAVLVKDSPTKADALFKSQQMIGAPELNPDFRLQNPMVITS